MVLANSTFTFVDSTDSTNNYAMARAHAGLARQGDAFFCPLQTNGKGQRGKKWQSGNAENIAISIVMEPLQLKINQQFQLSAAVAVATLRFFCKYVGNETTIKWPNDIYWRDRKAAGILIENIIGQAKENDKATGWKYAIIGIGVNVNQTIFDESLANPVSLKQITGKTFDMIVLAKELHLFVLEEIKKIMNGSFEEVFTLYNSNLYKKNCLVKLKKGNVVFETIIQSVSTNGQLLTTDAVDNHFNFGEIEWVLP